ncbi:capsular biosynthesis protein [Burkholderia pyrrocinia]|uniref:Capsular biosynthesis protein n=2 Tax=Burkholderia pyrrocinia TaxID=60550 RepID=A0A2Z5MZP5_BURPY|nr:capsular biosynthesis protein [Burkholderia pyrrocinia]
MERFRAACVFDPAASPSRPHPDLAASTRQRVLLIDEPVSDAFGTPPPMRHQAFKRMVSAARSTHPVAELWLARSGANERTEWLSARHPEICAVSRSIDPLGSLCASLPHFQHVYTVSAPEGMQALLCGVPVHVFGHPYYAGWGLTHDDADQPARQASATIGTLFDAIFVRLSQYIDPETGTIGELDKLLAAIATHRATARRFADVGRVAGVRFQLWKRTFAKPYLTAAGAQLRWLDRLDELRVGEYAAFWGARSSAGLPPETPVIRIEDGFLHSAGLGSDHVAPCSQVIDRRGIYFDASRPSDLTAILNEAEFADAELSRARALRETISNAGLTKYNLGRRCPTWHAPVGKTVILVPGQVADDASIRLGTRNISTIEDLVNQVRLQRPDAFIVYKPHPDVLSGNRLGVVEANGNADIVDTESDLASLIEISDEVHTLSSLSGFEALIRGKQVHTYGLPFYAGWGLTHDRLAQPWRDRRLTLDMLTAGVLIRYPVYWDWTWGIFTTPESVVSKMTASASRPLEKIEGNRMRPWLKAWRWSRNGILHLLSRD